MSGREKPLITTIIPTYRRPKLLRRAIKSVLNQTYPHFQVCIYDNASGDETAEVVTELAKEDTRVKYHCHSENIGALKNFNYGMKHVETPFFSFLSDDDILLPKFYEITLEGFEKYPEAMLSWTATAYMDYRGYFLSPFFTLREGLYKPPQGMIEIIKHWNIVWTGVIFHKEIIEKIGLIDEKVGAPADTDFVLRASAYFPFVFSLKPGAILFVNPLLGNESRRFHFTWPSWLKMISNLTEDEFISYNTRILVKQYLTEKLKKRLFQVGIASILRKNFDDAYESANVLSNNYHLRSRALFLFSMAKVCQYFPLAYYFIVFLDKIRRFSRRLRCRHLDKEFANYIRLLDE